MATYDHVTEVEEIIEPAMPQTAIFSVIAYIAGDLAVTALCSLSFTPYLMSLGLSNFSIIMILTFISFAVFGIAYYLFRKVFLKYSKRMKQEPFLRQHAMA